MIVFKKLIGGAPRGMRSIIKPRNPRDAKLTARPREEGDSKEERDREK